MSEVEGHLMEEACKEVVSTAFFSARSPWSFLASLQQGKALHSTSISIHRAGVHINFRGTSLHFLAILGVLALLDLALPYTQYT